jgi:hypothetical protein
MNYEQGKLYTVVDCDGITRTGTYTGPQQGAGVLFDVFETNDRYPYTPGNIVVYLPRS